VKGRGSESTRDSINSLLSILTIIPHKVFIKSTQLGLMLAQMRQSDTAESAGKDSEEEEREEGGDLDSFFFLNSG